MDERNAWTCAECNAVNIPEDTTCANCRATKSVVVQVDASEVALMATDRAQIDIQISTARQYPRSVTASLREATELATMDEETAESMFYVLKRGGKPIEGPSARLAEVLAYSWGNLRVQSVETGRDAKFVTATGTCMDLEKNFAAQVQVKRRITDKHGRTYSDDMIGVTSNAAISIALRNAVFKVIPRVYSQQIYKRARLASIGDANTFAVKRANALEWFAKAGIDNDALFKLLDIKGADDIGADQLITLNGMKTAIKEGDTTVDQLLAGDVPETKTTAQMNEAIDKQKTKDMEAEAENSKKKMDAVLKELNKENITPLEADAVLQKHAVKIGKMLPEHQQIISTKRDDIV